MKLWGGRFTKETNELVNNFNASISFDQKFYKQDIQGSIAHATMLAAHGIISEDEGKQITDGLKGILSDIESGKLEITDEYEDIHSVLYLLKKTIQFQAWYLGHYHIDKDIGSMHILYHQIIEITHK